ncbi:MAG: glycosyltransferase [Proteobacteria bacterium]|nr:glycosyltransferase [Pseudomonadota bacterium]
MPNDLSNLEFIVGIPSYMEADSIGHVTQQVDQGLRTHFPGLKSAIVNVDNNSPDDTKSAFLSTATQTPKHYITTRPGVKGKGNNLFNLFKFGARHRSTLKAAVVVDADLFSITGEWIKHLGEPVLKGYDYVLPYYSRHQFDGTITNHICYPLLYGLLGEDVRQPIGGEFGFSPALMSHWLDQTWTSTTRQYGIDIFMSLNAITGGFKICESGLGAKIHKASAPKLGAMFTQVLTTLFNFLASRKDVWLASPVINTESKKRFGLQRLDPPQELRIDIRALKEQLRDEYFQREHLLRKFLNDYAIMNLENMFEQDHYHLDLLMWTQVVYQLLYCFDTGSPAVKKEIIEALKPLYFARSVTFDYMTWRYNVSSAEAAIASQAKAFASQKPYLVGLYMTDGKGRAVKAVHQRAGAA